MRQTGTAGRYGRQTDRKAWLKMGKEEKDRTADLWTEDDGGKDPAAGAYTTEETLEKRNMQTEDKSMEQTGQAEGKEQEKETAAGRHSGRRNRRDGKKKKEK